MCAIVLQLLMYSSYVVIAFSVTSNIQSNVNDVPSYGFEIDYENNQFLLDGKPFRYVSGSFHYFRTPRAYWRDRLRKIRAAGLNAVSTYVEWSYHQPELNHWRWTDDADIVGFLTIAQEEDLLVLLRPGPFIDAERDLGGLPPWLLHEVPDIKMRTNDLRYMRYVKNYLDKLFANIKHLLRGNGGPIIMVQIENEYGNYYACDNTYKENLRNIIYQHVESKAVLYTTDGCTDEYLKCGIISGVYATVDFGASDNVQDNFKLMRKYQPNGPLVNSEYYSGWLTYWNEPFQRVSTHKFIGKFREILALNASLNIYMFHGGTNFGFTAGADSGEKYRPVITSYDYDAPLTEAGDPTDKYLAIRNAIAEFLPLPNLPIPTVSPKGNYSCIVEPVMMLFTNSARHVFATVQGQYDIPPTFEKLNFFRGFVLYESIFPPGTNDSAVIHADVADRGLVYVDDYLVGTLSRTLKINNIVVQKPNAKKLSIFVENQGHVDFGNFTNDWKGIFNTSIDGRSMSSWNITGYPLTQMMTLTNFSSINIKTGNLIHGPVILRGNFTVANNPLDTYLNTAGWGKGVPYVNGHNLGRYWPRVGPQITLYVPSVFLMTGKNELVLLELEYVPDNMIIKFQTTADFGENKI